MGVVASGCCWITRCSHIDSAVHYCGRRELPEKTQPIRRISFTVPNVFKSNGFEGMKNAIYPSILPITASVPHELNAVVIATVHRNSCPNDCFISCLTIA